MNNMRGPAAASGAFHLANAANHVGSVYFSSAGNTARGPGLFGQDNLMSKLGKQITTTLQASCIFDCYRLDCIEGQNRGQFAAIEWLMEFCTRDDGSFKRLSLATIGCDSFSGLLYRVSLHRESRTCTLSTSR